MKFYHQINSYLKETKHPFWNRLVFGSSFRLYKCSWLYWVFWQVPSHFWELYFFEASSATIEGTSGKLRYSETMMEISCTIFFRRILKIWDPFQNIFSFFLSYLIVQKRCVHFIVNSSHLGRSWRQLPKKLQMQLGALRGAANQPDPAVGRTSLIDFNLRQRSIMIYVWICEMITVSTIVDDTLVSWSCKAFFAHQSQCEGLEPFVRKMYVHTPLAIFSVEPRSCDCTWADSSIPSTISLWNDVRTWDTKCPREGQNLQQGWVFHFTLKMGLFLLMDSGCLLFPTLRIFCQNAGYQSFVKKMVPYKSFRAKAWRWSQEPSRRNGTGAGWWLHHLVAWTGRWISAQTVTPM